MQAVLKFTPDAQREAAALRAFRGRGCVRLLDYDPARSALLIERAVPGHTLATLCDTDDERATSIAASVIRGLPHEMPADPFPSIDTWLAELHPSPLAADALAVAAELPRSQQILLHGDLHQYNIVAAGDRWLAIDPKGVIGEPECEIAPLLLNPQQGCAARLRRRFDQLCDELSFDRRLAQAWSFVRVALSVLWAIEDDGEAPAEWIECVRVLRELHGTSTPMP